MKLAPGLNLPKDAITQKLAFLGRTGSGKTYAATKLAEEMLAVGAQIIVLDPVGVWYGLRLASNGRDPSGIDIPVFGGLKGDIPIQPTGGQLMADVLVDSGRSGILDVSQFESDADKARFARAFAERFFFRKKAAPSAVHLFLEEAQEFAPQNPAKDEPLMLHAFTRLYKLGRNFGIGGSLISQRPQEVNKKVLNMTECLFAFQMTGIQERKTVQQWTHDKGLDRDLTDDLPKLAVGTAHVWSPQWLQISKTVYIAQKATFNASSTPAVGAATKTRELAPIDLAKVEKQMSESIERAKQTDPRELKRRIAELERDLATARTSTPAPAKVKTIERSVVKPADVARIEQVVTRIEKLGELYPILREVADDLKRSLKVAAGPAGAALLPPPAHPSRDIQVAMYREPKPSAIRIPAGTPNGAADRLGAGERRVLLAVAQHPGGVTREQLTVLTGYRRSSRDTYIQRLRANDLLTINGQMIEASPAGIQTLGPDFEPLPTGSALLEHWLGKLPEGERRILGIVADVFPRSISRDQLTEATGYKRSSRDTYVQRLSARRLVDVSTPGEVRAVEMLFS